MRANKVESCDWQLTDMILNYTVNMDLDQVILHNLFVIGRLKQHEKLSTDARLYSMHRPSSWWASISRRVYNESRTLNIDAVSDTVQQARQVLEFNHLQCRHCAHGGLQSIYAHKANRFDAALVGAQPGIRALISTYSDDLQCVSRLTLILEETQVRPGGMCQADVCQVGTLD